MGEAVPAEHVNHCHRRGDDLSASAGSAHALNHSEAILRLAAVRLPRPVTPETDAPIGRLQRPPCHLDVRQCLDIRDHSSSSLLAGQLHIVIELDPCELQDVAQVLLTLPCRNAVAQHAVVHRPDSWGVLLAVDLRCKRFDRAVVLERNFRHHVRLRLSPPVQHLEDRCVPVLQTLDLPPRLSLGPLCLLSFAAGVLLRVGFLCDQLLPQPLPHFYLQLCELLLCGLRLLPAASLRLRQLLRLPGDSLLVGCALSLQLLEPLLQLGNLLPSAVKLRNHLLHPDQQPCHSLLCIGDLPPQLCDLHLLQALELLD